MADVKMCDRCGKVNYAGVPFVKVVCANGQERALSTIGNSHYDFDLCENCIYDLAQWFKKGVPTNEPNQM